MLAVCLPYDGNAERDWSYVLSHWAVDQIYIIGSANDYQAQPLRDATLIATAEDLPGGKPLALFAPITSPYFAGNVALPDFTHPADAIYMFGHNSLHVSSDELGTRVPDSLVYIPTNTSDDMFSYVAAAVALYDRQARG